MTCGLRLAVAVASCLLLTVEPLSLRSPHLVSSEAASPESRPRWPDQYQVSWTLDVPYIKELQKDGLTYHYQAWQDVKNGRQKTTRDGVESVIEFTGNNSMYQIYPRIDVYACRHMEIDGGKGPTRRLLGDKGPQLTLVLPDLREKRWHYNSSASIDDGPHKGVNARAFSWSVSDDMGYGETTATYTFFVSKDDVPLRLRMWGTNLYTGGHFDSYIVDYSDYKPGPSPDETWVVPDMCPAGLSPDNSLAAKQSHWLTKLRSVLPSSHFGDAAYDLFVHWSGRRHSSPEEYAQRRQVFYDNKAHIEAHNAANTSSHKLGVNHFADWSHEEFLAVVLPNRGAPRPSLWAAGESPRVHQREVPQHMLPRTVDWRGTLADSPVKDQAACGSCWAFGAVGSLEAAYFRETGQQKLLSEQHLMDCAWDKDDMNKGCMGGFQSLAFQWVFPHGGIASEADYPYRGVTDFCRKNVTLGANFKGGYVEVQGGEEGLMEALFTKGPMTVSVDAEPKSFVFYKEGIYNEPSCRSRLDQLDHAVIVSGYGTTDDGQDYWLVKNTWSTNWGMEGYLRIARQPHDCGIATQPIYVDLEILD